MYKNASDNEILEWLKRNKSIDYSHYMEYQSELSHRLKTYGADFIRLYGTEEEYQFALSTSRYCALYLHTLIKYLCNLNGVDFTTLAISSFNPDSLDFVVFPKGTPEMCDVLGDIEVAREDLDDSIPDFLDVGLVVSDETIYGAI